MPILRRLDFEYSKMPPYILMRDYFEFLRAIPLQRVGYIRVTHPSATLLPFGLTVRLACIRPAASVHPEPGSNSSLYISISFFSFPVLGSIFGINFSLFPYLSDFLAHLLKELFRFRLPLTLFFPIPSPSLANAKLHLFSFSTTLFLTFFYLFLSLLIITTLYLTLPSLLPPFLPLPAPFPLFSSPFYTSFLLLFPTSHLSSFHNFPFSPPVTCFIPY